MKYFILLILFYTFNTYAEDGHDNHNHDHNEVHNKKKSLKAHEHGVSILNIVQEQNTLAFEFEMPGFDVVGFEYRAKKKEDIKKVKNALNILSNYKNMIFPSASAECVQQDSMAKVINEGSHSEFKAEYILKCKNIDKIRDIQINYFSSFNFSKKLNINIITENKKQSQMTDKSNNKLDMDGYF